MARHVFHDGWRSIVAPKVSFSEPGCEAQHFTAVALEVPFHGVLGWPLTLFTSHERAVVRLVSTVFALVSIQLLYWILCNWLPPAPSAAGAALWATAPLTLHLGQVPMPDILCTTGMLAAFWYALRGHLPVSSGCFLFAILAKVSVIVFGLPILTALLLARNCRTWRNFLEISLAWGWGPLLGLLVWTGLLYSYVPPNRFSTGFVLAHRGQWGTLIQAGFYKIVLGCMIPFGLGVLGCAGVVFALRAQETKMDKRIKWSMILSNLIFFLFVVRTVPELQYFLPMLAWCVIPAAFGFNLLMDELPASAGWRVGLGFLVITHVLIALAFTIDLKTSRVPNFSAIERAANMLPPEARVVVVYRYYGASPAVWLNRNVVAFYEPADIGGRFAELRQFGFTHVLLLDIESWHNAQSGGGPLAWMGGLFQSLRKTPALSGSRFSGYTAPANPIRQYCDRHFAPLLDAPDVLLYNMTSAQGATHS